MQSVTFSLYLFLLWYCVEEHTCTRNVPSECRTDYSSGSLTEPCGFCHICRKEIDANNQQINHCTSISRWIEGASLALIIVYYGGLKDLCEDRKFCPSYCKCKNSLKNECAELMGSCKCVCNEGYYGQECEHVIPIGLSKESFADIDNIIFAPLIYSTDFAEFVLYFYSTGTNLKVKVETEREFLTFTKDNCKTNSVTSEDLCKTIFEGSDTAKIDSLCKSKPTYLSHECSLSINLAFPRIPVKKWNKKQFVLDYPTITNLNPNENIVAKAEHIVISVHNEISNIPQQIFKSDNGIMVVYIGKSNIERCGPFVTINQLSSTMYDMNIFSRRQELTVAASVMTNENPSCRTFGEPTLKWIVWIIAHNHNEKSDLPINHKEDISALEFPPYTLWYGIYKVKHEVILNTNYFSYGASYCYFKIVPLPVDPVAFGGSLRYIYYKNNVELITSPLIDPNFPLHEQPQSECVWYCNDTSDSICQRVKSNSFHNIWHMLVLTLSSPFTPGKAYNFTMEIISPNFSQVESSNQVIIVSKEPIPDLLIECLRNCGGKYMKSLPEEIIYFRVLHSQYSIPISKESVYKWTYSTSNTPDTSVETIRQIEETPSWILIINEHSLKFDQLHTFKVIGGDEIPGEAQITVKTSTSNVSDTFQCTISPKKGIAGESKFQINCTGYNSKEMSQTFTFYDKINENDQNARILCSSFTGMAENVMLTRGQVLVSATNVYGQSKYTTSSVILQPQEITSELLTKSLETIETLSNNEGYEQKLSFISALADILNINKTMKQEAMDIFLEIISKEKVPNLVKMEMLLSTTLNVICHQDGCITLANQKNYQYLVEIFSQVTNKFSSVINLSKEDSQLRPAKILKLYKLILQCAGVLLNVQDIHLEDKHYNIYKTYKYGNLKSLRSLSKINTGLAIRNLPYIKSTVVESSMIDSYMKEDNANYFMKTRYKYNSYIKLSSKLADDLNKNFSTIVVQTINFKNNPYWWSSSDQVTTDVLSLKIGSVKRERHLQNYGRYRHIRILKHPIDIFLTKHTFENKSVSGNLTKPHPGGDPDVVDQSVAVHQIYPSKGSKVSVRFVDLSENDVFNVLIELNQRPDYYMVQEKGITITALSPWYLFSKEINNEDDFVFIGILPGANVSVGNKMKYTFELESARCQVWYDVAWSTSGCKVGTESTEHHLHCQCDHLSFITGVLKVPMNTVSPFEDYKLFLTIPDNPYVFAFITSIFIIYIILLIWACKKDRRDRQKTDLIILEDNISSDLYGYLIIVCTGSRLFASTSSNIGIILNGSECNSRSHILRSSKRTTLQRGSDDWFLLYAPEYLGIISSIELWTDHSGLNPNWFCSRIYVHDLHSKDDYTFVVDQWFGITQAESCIEKCIGPITFEKGINFSAYFLTNAISGFRENHLLVSITGAYPRSPLLKSQRLSMAMVLLMVTLLTSIMFYNVAIPQLEDVPNYRITTQDIVISVYSLIIATVTTGTVAFAFKKSYVTRKSNTQLKKQQKIQVDKLKDGKITRKSGRNVLIYYLYKVILLLRKQQFFPIKAATDKHEYIVIHKKRAMIAWSVCILVIVICAYLVILLGLKIGKVKSLLWLTSIGLSFGEDNFLVTPLKILMLAILFGMFEAQFCDMFAYDPNIYEIRNKSNVQINTDKDTYIHELRLKPYYKHVSIKRWKTIKMQQVKIQKWWTFIDIIDICFPAVFIFLFVSWYSYAYYNNSLFEKLLFEHVHSDDKPVYKSLQISKSVLEYIQHLENTILPAMYSTDWYNKLPLSEDLEAFKETGWTVDTTHRILGVPRLRQIRVREQYCKTSQLLQHISPECNVQFSSHTEDTDSYGPLWKGSSWNHILLRNSPWTYHAPENTTSITIFSKLSQSFHGGGYLVELSQIHSKSDAIIHHLIDTKWLDWRTHIVFFVMTTYNVNVNAFSSIVFLTEFFENKLIMVGTQIMSLFSRNEYIYLDLLGFLYGILGLSKLIMTFNNIGIQFFWQFWTLYDLILISIGMSCLLGYRVFLVTASMYIRDFQTSGKDQFFQFQKLFFSLDNEIKLLTVFFTLINIRLLRLSNYGNRNLSRKLKKTLYMTFSYIPWVTLVCVLFIFIGQRLILVLMSGFLHIQYTHNVDLVVNKVLFHLPYLLHPVVLMIYTLVIVQGYRRASTSQKTN